jgi:Tol biopolymer transport system component
MSQIAFWTPYEVILAINADGTNLRTVTTGPHDQNPVWSPDARKLAFQSSRNQPNDLDIYVVNWDGSGLQRLTGGPANDRDPAWSPDGRKIAFARDGNTYVMNADGSGVTQLSMAGLDSHASWSPDGSRIVFESARSGVNAIHVMNADGSNVIQLTSDSANDFSPSWSPDGRMIAFHRHVTSGYGWPFVYVMNADGSGLRRLAGGGGPVWSPDSRRVLFELFGMTSMFADGTGLKRMGSGFSPSWSPVGKMPSFPGPFRSIEKVGGDGQVDTMLAILPESLSVRVLGDDGSPQAGAVIQWDMLFEGPDSAVHPTLSGHLQPTNAAGTSSVQMRLGSRQPVVLVRAALLDGTARKAEIVFTETAAPKP